MAQPHLHGVYCPCCRSRIGTVVLEGPPVVLNHHHRAVVPGRAGTIRCDQQYVAVPDPSSSAVRLVPVAGRREADAILTLEARLWYERWTALMDAVA